MPENNDWIQEAMNQIHAAGNIYMQQVRRPAQVDPYQWWQAHRVNAVPRGVNLAEWIIVDDIIPAPPPVPVVDDIPTKDFIEMLQRDYPSLHLAGSRWFRHRAIQEGLGPDYIMLFPETDYDLFIEDSVNGREWLKSEGFSALNAIEQYMDEFTTGIWTNPLFPLIQISTRRRADAYKWAIENMPLVVYKQLGWKSGPAHPQREEVSELFENWTNEGIKVIEEMNF